MTVHVNVDLREQLRELEVEGVEETDKELGRGAYGVVVELKVNGLRYIFASYIYSAAPSSVTPGCMIIYCMDVFFDVHVAYIVPPNIQPGTPNGV